MSNRNLVVYEESRLEDGPYWTLEVQRSAAGQPGALFTIRHESVDGTFQPEEMTIFVDDADKIVRPIQEWLVRGI